MRREYLLAAVCTALVTTGCNELIAIDRFMVRDAGEQVSDGGDMDAGGPAHAGGTDAGAQDGGPTDAGLDAAFDAGDAPPTVVFLSGSVPDGGTTNSSLADFTFVANPAGPSVTYECQLESVTGGASTSTGFVPCPSSTEGRALYRLVDAGLYTLSVRAMNTGTGFGPPSSRSWNLEALDTDIRTIQEGVAGGTFDLDTIVEVTGRVQHVFSGADFSFDTVVIADAGGSTLSSVAWHGIFTLPRNAEPGFPVGVSVTVTGRVNEDLGTTMIEEATYERLASTSPYPFFYTRDSDVLEREELEGLVVEVGGFVPSSNCASCALASGAGICIETCEGGCHPLPYWTDVIDPDYGESGFYTGAVTDGELGSPELWVFEFVEQGDACL